MFDAVGMGILVVLLIVFGALTMRALRARRLWVKIIGGVPAGLLTLAVGAVATMSLIGFARINTKQNNPVREVTVVSNAATLAHGEKFARACAGCHSQNGQLPLAGNPKFFGDAPFGTFGAPNLTQAQLKDWSDGEIIRAIREGVGRDGRSLLIMPSSSLHHLSDDDVHAIVAYLRSQPADTPAIPTNSLNVLGAMMFGALNNVQSVQPPIEGVVTAPPAGPTAEYGIYLTKSIGCADCHGENLTGGVSPDTGEHTPNLVNVSKAWSESQFIQTMRTGVTPEGHTMSEGMPWKDYEKFSDDDLRALYYAIRR